ncbi:hypothetical protein [Mycobacterium simiae]|uniref:hypothetical protein n=1 Tax=Mycobacterium simiae TaxID=1784 RepID=UPI00041E77E0|nr:hypothetical protein [Mycobacterium simiae]PLV48031.1 hypothetical protein X011_17815 [Mycobacterium tuberculosis variant microti OV254]
MIVTRVVDAVHSVAGVSVIGMDVYRFDRPLALVRRDGMTRLMEVRKVSPQGLILVDNCV